MSDLAEEIARPGTKMVDKDIAVVESCTMASDSSSTV
jgi:hypothetical protein